MSVRLYIPKSLLLGLLFIAAGALGWMLRASANDVARAEAPTPAVSETDPAVARPPMSAHPGKKVMATASGGDEVPTAPGPSLPVRPPSSTGRLLPAATGDVAAPGSTFALDTQPSASNPGLLDSTGDVSAAGSSFALTTSADGSRLAHSASADRARSRNVVPVTRSDVPGVAQAGPGGFASYPLAVPSPVLQRPSSPANPSYSPVPAMPPQPSNVMQSSPATTPGSWTTSSRPLAVDVPPTRYPNQAPEVGPFWVHGAPSYIAPILSPLPGAKTRGVSFSEWESYRTDLAGRNIIATTDDSNLWKDRNGKLNGNTGDTDASGLNVTDATDAVIRGTESADEAPYQTVAAAMVDLASEGPATVPVPANPVHVATPARNGEPEELRDPVLPTDGPSSGVTIPTGTQAATPVVAATTPVATRSANRFTANAVPAKRGARKAPGASATYRAFGGDDSSTGEGFDFPYAEWTQQISGDAASAVHTDEGTTLASGQDAVVVGADGMDDDDNRAVGENIVVTRDDGNITLGGTGDVNSQIGDSEQGAVIMGVNRVFIQGGGAY
jgi:hypothetical protein